MSKSQTNEAFARNVDVPQETESYKPVPHGDVLDLVREGMQNRDMSFDNTRILTNKKGTQMTALFDSNVAGYDDQMRARLVVVNSYDKTQALSFRAATSIKVCDNGLFVDSEDFGHATRKHTGSINEEINEKMYTAIDQLTEHLEQAEAFKEKAEEKPLDHKQMSEIAGELFVREELINTQQLSLLKDEINQPSFNEFDYRNAWCFYNHVTYSMREANPLQYAKAHKQIHQFIEQNVIG